MIPADRAFSANGPLCPNDATPSRRAVLTAAPAVAIAVTMPAAAVPATAVAVSLGQHPDAELITLGAEFDRRHQRFLEVKAETRPFHAAFLKMLNDRVQQPQDGWAEYCRLSRASGHDAACERQSEALKSVDEIGNRIREMPAKSFAGLLVKAKVAAHDCGFSEKFAVPEDDMDWDAFCFLSLLRNVERLAAAEHRTNGIVALGDAVTEA